MPLPRGTIEGRLVVDPSLRFGPSGVAVCGFRVVASDRRKNDQTNEWEDGDQLWIDVTCFRQLAENCAESLQKGEIVLCQGKYRTEEWTDRDTGAKRSKVTFIADVVGPSLQFRTMRHGEGRAQRDTGSVTESGSSTADPWATPSTDDPPF